MEEKLGGARGVSLGSEEDTSDTTALDLLVPAEEPERAARVLMSRGREFISRGRVRDVVRVLDEIDDDELDPVTKARLSVFRGDVEVLMGWPDRSLRSYERALANFREMGRQELAGWVHRREGALWRTYGALDQSNEVLELGLDVLSDKACCPEAGRIHTEMAHVNILRGRPQEALRHSLAALAISADLDDTRGLAKTHNLLSYIFFELGQEENARRSHYLSCKIKEKTLDESREYFDF